MPRRVGGDPTVEPWRASAEERQAERERAERERRSRERVASALRIADYAAAEALGYEPGAVRRLAQLNAETLDDVGHLARQLADEGYEGWSSFGVSACIQSLWPYGRRDEWPKQYGTYPGYLGGLRDRLTISVPAPTVIGPRRHQYACDRCGALWPTGWPDADDRDPYQRHCPDCGKPGWGRSPREEREHTIIDLHWLTFRFAPRPVGPCPVCGHPRELLAQGYVGIKERVLYWSCGESDELGSRGQPDSHYRRSLERAEWESPGAHHAYWLAVDMLRLCERTGEVTELPVGAEYEALDGSGERWIFGSSGWTRQQGG